MAPLLARLNHKDVRTATAAAATLHSLGESQGTAALGRFLASEDVDIRHNAVCGYARQKEILNQKLLSRDLDANTPWLDPKEPITEVQVAKAARELEIPPEQVRSRFKAMAGELNLKLGWEQ